MPTLQTKLEKLLELAFNKQHSYAPKAYAQIKAITETEPEHVLAAHIVVLCQHFGLGCSKMPIDPNALLATSEALAAYNSPIIDYILGNCFLYDSALPQHQFNAARYFAKALDSTKGTNAIARAAQRSLLALQNATQEKVLMVIGYAYNNNLIRHPKPVGNILKNERRLHKQLAVDYLKRSLSQTDSKFALALITPERHLAASLLADVIEAGSQSMIYLLNKEDCITQALTKLQTLHNTYPNDDVIMTACARALFADGPHQNTTLAAKLFLQAARQPNDEAKYFLALCYRDGKGMPQNLSAAAGILYDLARKSEHKQNKLYVRTLTEMANTHPRHLMTLEALAICYEEGLGVTQDHSLARSYYERAKQAGSVGANLALIGLQTPEQRSDLIYEVSLIADFLLKDVLPRETSLFSQTDIIHQQKMNLRNRLAFILMSPFEKDIAVIRIYAKLLASGKLDCEFYLPFIEAVVEKTHDANLNYYLGIYYRLYKNNTDVKKIIKCYGYAYHKGNERLQLAAYQEMQVMLEKHPLMPELHQLIATMEYLGGGVARNITSCIMHLETAAKLNYIPACLLLVKVYLDKSHSHYNKNSANVHFNRLIEMHPYAEDLQRALLGYTDTQIIAWYLRALRKVYQPENIDKLIKKYDTYSDPLIQYELACIYARYEPSRTDNLERIVASMHHMPALLDKYMRNPYTKPLYLECERLGLLPLHPDDVPALAKQAAYGNRPATEQLENNMGTVIEYVDDIFRHVNLTPDEKMAQAISILNPLLLAPEARYYLAEIFRDQNNLTASNSMYVIGIALDKHAVRASKAIAILAKQVAELSCVTVNQLTELADLYLLPTIANRVQALHYYYRALDLQFSQLNANQFMGFALTQQAQKFIDLVKYIFVLEKQQLATMPAERQQTLLLTVIQSLDMDNLTPDYFMHIVHDKNLKVILKPLRFQYSTAQSLLNMIEDMAVVCDYYERVHQGDPNTVLFNEPHTDVKSSATSTALMLNSLRDITDANHTPVSTPESQPVPPSCMTLTMTLEKARDLAITAAAEPSEEEAPLSSSLVAAMQIPGSPILNSTDKGKEPADKFIPHSP